MATKFTWEDDGEPEPSGNGKNGSNGHGPNGGPLSGEIVPRNGNGADLSGIDLKIRDARILDLKAQGWTVQALADEFSMSKSSAHKAIRRALALIPSQSAEEVRRMADIAMDRSLRKLAEIVAAEHVAVSQGKVVTMADPVTGEEVPVRDSRPVIDAIREIRETWESRRKMHGADAATKTVNARIPESVVAERIAELQKATGTAGIRDPAVRALLGIEEPFGDYEDDDDG